MNANYQNLLIPTVIIIGTLLSSLILARWWRERMYDLNGKTVLITGGSRGLGLVMARQLIQAGARLAICARDTSELERARTELEQGGGEVLAIPCDVTDQTQVEQMVQQVRDWASPSAKGDRFGQIDVLINNAGTDLVGPMDVLTMEDYDDLMKLHFWAPLYTTYAVLPQMRQRQAGRIVNISSIGGKVIFPHMLAYCASKFALTGLSEGMRAELAKEGIAVTTVCPGFIRTGVLPHVIFKGQHRKEYTWFSIGDSLPLISTSAEHVARQVIAGFRRGDAEVIVPLPAWFSARLYALFPGLSATVLGWVNRLLPGTGGIGSDRAFGKDSHSSWSPSLLTSLSDKAARENNEIATENADGAGADQPVETERSHRQVEAQRVVIGETDSFGITAGTSSPEPAIAEDEQSGFPLIEPSQAPTEIQACLSDIQDTLGIPWIPASWRAYAMYPSVMQLFWERLKPATQTESFLEDAIAITERVYRDTNDWYLPSYQIDVNEAQRHQIQRVLNAFTFGNPQLLIQQIALSRTLAGEVVGQEGNADVRRGPNANQHSEIQLIGEQSVREISAEMQQVYRDIKQTLGVPIVNSDYQALARWSAFFLPAWEDIKLWRERPEYQLLKQDIVRRAENAANRLCPAVAIGEREVRDRLDNPEDFERIQQTVQMFKDVLPELIVQDALFHMGLANLQSVTKL
jgi:NAD(P)-dependent dehydrogenase (short-subunit alcohol dehydrogenase family)